MTTGSTFEETHIVLFGSVKKRKKRKLCYPLLLGYFPASMVCHKKTHSTVGLSISYKMFAMSNLVLLIRPLFCVYSDTGKEECLPPLSYTMLVENKLMTTLD